MTDLVILLGIKRIIDGEFPHLKIFTEFEVELGNENKKDHDITSKAEGKVLIGEAFNVAPSFFNVKKSKTIKKLKESTLDADYLILLCNEDSHEHTTKSSSVNNIEIIKVNMTL